MVMRMMLFYGEIARCQGYQKIDRFTKQGDHRLSAIQCKIVQYRAIQWNTVQQCRSPQYLCITLVHPMVFCAVNSALQKEAGGSIGLE